MPNWCYTYLTIRVPTPHVNALLQALEGPQDWAMPSTQPRMLGRLELSAHQSLALDGLLDGQDAHHKALRAEWMGKMRAYLTTVMGAPEWMPITREDMRFHWLKENGLVPEIYFDKIVPLSLAKLQPWDDRFLFDQYFPGVVDDEGIWAPAPHRQRAYNDGTLGPIAFRTNVLGTKWSPGDVERGEPVHDEDGTSRILFSYRTAWGPIETIGELLGPTLLAHQAQALLYWQEEDMHNGWAYVNPAAGIDAADHWTRESHTTTVADPDDPEDSMWEWDSEAMAQAAQDAAEADFLPLVP